MKSIEDLLKMPLPEKPGPVVTISRECGCPALPLADRISKALQNKNNLVNGAGDWQVINREAVLLAAKNLQLDPVTVERAAGAKPPGVFGNIFRAFSDTYVPTDIEIKKSVAEIVQYLGHLGRFLIVGRGGAVLTSYIRNSLHIQLYASLEWRTKRVMEAQGVDKAEAGQIIQAVDQERLYLRNFYSGEYVDRGTFDVMFNCETMSEEEICESALAILTIKKIIA